MNVIRVYALALGLVLGVAASSGFGLSQPPAEVRGTWISTTGSDAVATPAKTKETMRRLKEAGLNTVYVEVWKNGYTQYPSKVLQKNIGVDRRPDLMPKAGTGEPRDLLLETLVEAHRNGLVYHAWFEYGFMAAFKNTDNHLRRMKPEWMSRDIKGNDVAPNGFVWMNPLHPETRRFLLDLVLEAVDTYDLDGVQLDDRIVWPYITMGYDDYTKKIYAQEHGGQEPPADHTDEAWCRWRADKINEYAKQFVQEVRDARPGLLISLSPAVYPWCYENYCLEWPTWAAWTSTDAADLGDFVRASGVTPRWDEFIPQCYRFSYDAFEKTWLDQVKWMKEKGGGRVADMMPGIRVVGEGPDALWDDVRRSIELARSTGSGGHVLWYSPGVIKYEKELAAFYDASGKGRHAKHPKIPEGWRPPGIPLTLTGTSPKGEQIWTTRVPEPDLAEGRYQRFGLRAGFWKDLGTIDVGANAAAVGITTHHPDVYDEILWLRDRRVEKNTRR
jgi:uncharacterized lipoprotein YddW (UPF0748 family)